LLAEGNNKVTDALDDKVRSRLAEIRAAAGVPHAQVSLDVLYFLPEKFLNAYQNLFSKALRADSGEDQRARSQREAGEVGKATGGRTGGSARRYKRAFVVLDERALDIKTLVDKRLRSMAREVEAMMEGGVLGKTESARCPSCGAFVQDRWNYCPMEGARLSID
jgi:hypothetical protein